MKRILGTAVGLCLYLSLGSAFAAEQLAGMWQMVGQQLGTAHMPPDPIALKVTEVSGGLKFEYLVGREMELARSFTAHLDGTAAVITDAKGVEIGRAKVTRTSPTEYKVSMQAPRKPPEPGTMSIAEDGKILRCESDIVIPGKGPTHLSQMFARLEAQDR